MSNEPDDLQPNQYADGDQLRANFESSLRPRYRLEEELGEGGMGRVFRAIDVKHSRPVAIKLLRPELSTPRARARFAREVRAVASLRHPHILPLIDSGEFDRIPYFIAPLIEGDSVHQRLRRDGPMSLEEALPVIRDVARALDYAHRRGFVHRDIKPGNVLLADGEAIVADFGIARAMASDEDDGVSSAGLAMGTPKYMSPEQIEGSHEVDGRADIYSLACMVFEMLAGEPPFAARNQAAVLAGHLSFPPPDIGLKLPELAGSVSAALRRSLSKSPSDRHDTAGALYHDLAAGTGSGVRPFSSRQRWYAGRQRTLALGVGIAAIAGVLLLLPPPAVSPGPITFMPVVRTTGSPTDAPRAVAASVEEELTRLLSGWKQADALPGPISDGSDSQPSLDEALDLARSGGANTLVYSLLTLSEDSARLEARPYDTSTRVPTGPPVLSAALRSDASGLGARAAAQLFGFQGDPDRLADFKRDSRDLDAVRGFFSAQQDFERWHLTSAERRLRAVLSVDSTFSRAHHLLSATLYWQASSNPVSLPLLQGEMRQHATTAHRLAREIGRSDSLAIAAFFDFQNGRYEDARKGYNELIADNPDDLYSLLFLGAVEFRDPFAVETAERGLRPRGDWNAAKQAFERTLAVAPDFFIGFGHIQDIHSRLAEGLRLGSCSLFQRPGDRVLLLGEFSDPSERVTLCPVVQDSISWVEYDERATGPNEEAARTFHAEVEVDLRRWVSFAPSNPRPHHALAEWLIDEAEFRSRAGSTRTWSAMLAPALPWAEAGLRLARDTTVEQLTTVANLRLAAGDLSGAVAAVDRAREQAAQGHPTVALPGAAANPYLATGRTQAALTVGAASASQESILLRDSTGTPLPVLVEASIFRLRVLGSLGVSGDEITDTFEEIESTWIEAGYTPQQTATLRRRFGGQVRLALLSDSALSREWRPDLSREPHAFRGIRVAASDPGSARILLDSAKAGLSSSGATPIAAYATGLLAQALSDHTTALDAFRALDVQRISISEFREGWGVRTLAWMKQARSLEALGRPDEALVIYEAVADAWSAADSPLALLSTESRASAAQLREVLGRN